MNYLLSALRYIISLTIKHKYNYSFSFKIPAISSSSDKTTLLDNIKFTELVVRKKKLIEHSLEANISLFGKINLTFREVPTSNFFSRFAIHIFCCLVFSIGYMIMTKKGSTEPVVIYIAAYFSLKWLYLFARYAFRYVKRMRYELLIKKLRSSIYDLDALLSKYSLVPKEFQTPYALTKLYKIISTNAAYNLDDASKLLIIDDSIRTYVESAKNDIRNDIHRLFSTH